MKSRSLLCLLITVSLITGSVEAQQPGKIPRVGVLISASTDGTAPFIEAFRQGLREQGYVEGKNVLIEYRYAEGRLERVPELAKERSFTKLILLLQREATLRSMLQ
jgi:putative ABC transport system substrate-binding protein